ncbi:Ankk1 [Symbiodinium sp. KB8]|nr:Ankk1 [Symbiodinium sp. KB8]
MAPRLQGRPLAPCYLGPPKEVDAVPEGYARVYHNRRRTSWTDYKLAERGDDLSLSRQSTADTDISMDPKQQPDGSFSMTPSTQELLAQLDAEKCIGCCMQRSRILHEALTYCRIPGYVQPCAEDGWSPLLIATQRRNYNAVQTLLAHGAEVDCKEPQSGWTPLMFAASLGDCDIVKILLDKNASINEFASPHDWNPLCCALQANNKDVVRILLDAGADVSLIKRRHPALAELYECELEDVCGTPVSGR